MTRPATRLGELVRQLDGATLVGDGAVEIRGVAYDSRRVGRGDLFVAVPGLRADGHDFLEQARRAGASAAVVERGRQVDTTRWPAVVEVDDGREALARLAAAFWGRPALRMKVVGITGTNGKTSLTYLLESIAGAAGRRAGVIGTTGARWPSGGTSLEHTTPEAPELQRILFEMAEAGVEYVFMEASSHALDLKRTCCIDFSLGVFTNLSRDHLDYHGDIESYAAAKSLLFARELAASRAPAKAAVYNAGDPYWQKVVGGWAGEAVAFGLDASAQVSPAGQPRFAIEGTYCRVKYPGGTLELRSRLTGRHNLENLLAAVAVAHLLGFDGSQIEKGVRDCTSIPGRLERVGDGGPAVLVDYAHTPDALEKVLLALKQLARGRLWVVFGCGGDRDRGKRPQMGRVAASHADIVIVTSDNPRTEDPGKIIEQILPGVREAGIPEASRNSLARQRRAFWVEPDRRLAIRAAVELAGEDDVVLIAGKGHEDYQIVGTTRRHFDDREEAAWALRQRSSGA